MNNLFDKGQVIDFSPISLLPLLGIIIDSYCRGYTDVVDIQVWKYDLIIYSGGKLVRTTASVIEDGSTTYNDCTLLLEGIIHHRLDGILSESSPF